MSTDPGTLHAVAVRLREAERTGVPVAPVRDELAEGGIEAAYAVQVLNTEHALAQGRRVVGRKIGLTSKAVQLQLGVDSPDFGTLFADMALCDGDEIPLSGVLQPKVEAEVAFVLGRDLAQSRPGPAEVIAATEFVLPAIEIVGSRIEKWNIRMLDTVADNASSGLFVVGNEPRRLRHVDLRNCGMVMERAGEQVSIGSGAACLGHPLNAVVWLARKMSELGQPLRAGDVVMSGALGPMVAVTGGEVFEVRIDGLGSVRIAFGR